MQNWQAVCSVTDLAPNVGVCALVEGEQVAIFNCTRTQSIYAISNYDPFGKANVLSRGLIGGIGDQPHVASPLYKQHFNLKTGVCLEDESVVLKTYPVEIKDGVVHIAFLEEIAA
ncbi:nitrite reductase small subunit NirD [Vibrio ulleungensis]|uniref:Nitrite reductase small subunit NirD n=1 Tax=Vibrio ulleungensis TaxID=2807619 RepID=A0ABS2HIV6_9VIBR|nr:nitrite reductase small subunit NirD [Vibrio ulleungensis]MBM7037031.1 nitrite reductase small subunit NirD [Vibrio ulleungensis]